MHNNSKCNLNIIDYYCTAHTDILFIFGKFCYKAANINVKNLSMSRPIKW